MKTYSILTVIAALVAFSLSFFTIELSSSLLFTIGLGVVATYDYTRQLRSLERREAKVLSFPSYRNQTSSELELAA